VRLIECVPNFSEGRDLAVIDAIRAAIEAVPGTSVLHTTSDASHHRSVITFVAPHDIMADAAFAAIKAARDHIDITRHTGVHPRIGAADVVPFIPLDGATMEDCIAIANEVGARVGAELDIPVYLYERAAAHPSRRNLADVRRGGFEGLREAIVSDPERFPDFGPARLHPTFGAVAIGARPFLVAFNVYLGGAQNLLIAKAVARAVRQSNGGLPAVKALGLEVDGQAQVSMNLVDVEQTTLVAAYEAVRAEAATLGARVTWSEIIGLVPEQMIFGAAAAYLQLRQPIDAHILERKLLEVKSANAIRADDSPDVLRIDDVASGAPTPGGGSVAAYVGALAGALTQMVAKITLDRPKFAAAHEELRRVVADARDVTERLQVLTTLDADAYQAVMDGYALPRNSAEETALRERVINAMLRTAARVPLETAQLCVRVAEIAEVVSRIGTPNAVTDAGTAALLAEAACKSAVYNVLVNLRGLSDSHDVTEWETMTDRCIEDATRLSRLVTERVNERVSRRKSANLG